MKVILVLLEYVFFSFKIWLKPNCTVLKVFKSAAREQESAVFLTGSRRLAWECFRRKAFSSLWTSGAECHNSYTNYSSTLPHSPNVVPSPSSAPPAPPLFLSAPLGTTIYLDKPSNCSILQHLVPSKQFIKLILVKATTQKKTLFWGKTQSARINLWVWFFCSYYKHR